MSSGNYLKYIAVRVRIFPASTPSNPDSQNCTFVSRNTSSTRDGRSRQNFQTRRDLTALAERVAAFSDTHERLAIRAPVSGTIVNLAVTTVGGVLKSGDRVLDIVPNGDELIVEAKVDPRYIDRVHAGLQADLRFDAYLDAFQRPIVAGDVEVVSADAMPDERTGAPYYKVRVTIPPTERALLSSLELQPDMPCTVMIKTGEHSLLTYLVQPMMRRFVGALAEP